MYQKKILILAIYSAIFSFNFAYYYLATPRYITFSDSTKYAQAGVNLLRGRGLTTSHSFFSPSSIDTYSSNRSWTAGFLPFPSLTIALLFSIFYPSDFVLTIFGMSLFALGGVLVFLITQKLVSFFAALIATSLYALNLSLLDYSTNLSSEIFFTIEILFFIYLTTFKNRTYYLSILPLLLMFLTRPQAYLFLLSLITFRLIKNLTEGYLVKNPKNIFLFTLILIVFFYFAFKHTSSPFSPLSIIGSINIRPNTNPGVYLRGLSHSLSAESIVSKVIYNLYNFAKSPGRILPESILALFITGMFFPLESKKVRNLRILSLICLIIFIISASITLPNARYIHPLIPLIIISAVASLAEFTKRIGHQKVNIILMTVLIFPAINSLGHIIVDYRFRKANLNIGKPPSTKVISDVLTSKIKTDGIIITNLDAWAAWYYDLPTMWFPLRPADLGKTNVEKISYIFITDYKGDEVDFELGEWADVVNNPDSLSNEFLSSHFTLLDQIQIAPEQVYENEKVIGTILINKSKIDDI